MLREAAKIEEHFDVLVSVGSLEMLRCHHANKLSRNSEQEKTFISRRQVGYAKHTNRQKRVTKPR